MKKTSRIPFRIRRQQAITLRALTGQIIALVQGRPHWDMHNVMIHLRHELSRTYQEAGSPSITQVRKALRLERDLLQAQADSILETVRKIDDTLAGRGRP
jgi:hypothetical protein